MARNLESHRFDIKPESKELIIKVRDFVEKLKKEFSEIQGVSFFGSRTISKENEISDLDMVIFYDGSDFSSGIESEYNIDLEDKAKQKSILLRTIRERLNAFINTNCQFTKQENSILFDDLSKNHTDELIEDLIDSTDHSLNKEGKFEVFQNGLDIPHEVLCRRFFLGSGEALYSSRSYILDKLEHLPNGERYLFALMESVKFMERKIKTDKRPEGLPEYKNYPKTISEARNYFITRAPNITKK